MRNKNKKAEMTASARMGFETAMWEANEGSEEASDHKYLVHLNGTD